MSNPDFARITKLMKMKIPLFNILLQTRAGGVFSDDDICLFATKSEIAALKRDGNYKGTKYL